MTPPAYSSAVHGSARHEVDPEDQGGDDAAGKGALSTDESTAVSIETTAERQISELTVASGSSGRSQEGYVAFEGQAPDVTLVQSWGSDEVVQWMKSVGLGPVALLLRATGVTGAELTALDGRALVSIGVKALGDRKRILKAISQLEVDAHQVTKNSGGRWSRHLMFMASSPLVRLDGTSVHPLRAIDVETESQAVSNAIASSEKVCRFQLVYAKVRTISWAALHQSCCVLIFSGHTLPSGEWLLETESGEALPFDPGNLFQQETARAVSGGFQDPPAPTFFAGPDLSQDAELAGAGHPELSKRGLPHAGSDSPTMQRTQDRLEAVEERPATNTPRVGPGGHSTECCQLVCIHASHPEVAAERFLSAGIPYVITMERYKDDAKATEMASVFWESLSRCLLQEKSVQQAFDAGKYSLKCWASSVLTHKRAMQTNAAAPVDANAVKEEVQMDLDKRLKLLRLDPELTLKPLQSLNEGHPPASMVSLAPAQFPRTGLEMGGIRRVEMWRVLRALRFRRLVQVLGARGVGKRMLVCLLAKYAWRRNLFPAGIHYVHVDDLCSSTAGGSLCLTGTPSLLGHKLLILDGCEELYQRGLQSELVTWITRLLAVSAEVQIVVTATSLLTIDNMGDPLLGNLEMHTVEVPELSVDDALRLLRWRLKDHPEQHAFVDTHGGAVIDCCRRLPFLVTVFAGLLAQGSLEQNPASLLEQIEAELGTNGTEVVPALATPDLVLRTLLSFTPTVVYGALKALMVLPIRFSSADALDCLSSAMQPEGTDQLLGNLKERHFICSADDGSVARMLSEGSGQACPQSGPLLCLHPALRRYLQKDLQQQQPLRP
mmetsp:Transcript_3685/g.9364  ORF Transcript_3685/g.9364 Transcript_3685/m.9364 type:complete len:834 (-) Transcript_3685:218-2719(-)